MSASAVQSASCAPLRNSRSNDANSDKRARQRTRPHGRDSEELGANRNCDKRKQATCDLRKRQERAHRRPLGWLLLVALLVGSLQLGSSQQQAAPIIVDHHHQHHQPHPHHQGQHSHNQRAQQQQQHLLSPSSNINQQQPRQPQLAANVLGQHFQPASLVLAQNKWINFTHVLVDELTNSVYVGATNWLLQLSGADLRVEQAIRTGPTAPGGLGATETNQQQAARDCAPADCVTQLAQVHDLDSLLLSHAHNVIDLSGPGLGPAGASPKRLFTGATMHTSGPNGTATTGAFALLHAQRRPSGQPSQAPATAATLNNYNKILAIDHESRQLLVCGSLNQGACRRHQLGNLGNFSELIPLPVASNDEHSSTVALIPSGAPAAPWSGGSGGSGGPGRPGSRKASEHVMYVAATNSRLGPYRELVPAISARSLNLGSRDRYLEIIERSFTDSARVDVSVELRDYYLVNYVYAFQHQEFVYFATVQRKSPLRSLEEQGYQTRLARLCLNDFSFQSYAEMTLECVGETPAGAQETQARAGSDNSISSRRQQQVDFNLLQDAHLMQAGSQLQQQLGLAGARHQSQWVLAGAFAPSRDHTTRSSQRSAICLFPMDKIEARFNENIDLCYNGTIKSRNMNYIAGSVNECPRQPTSSAPNMQNYCNEPIKLNGSLALVSEAVAVFDNELLTSISSTLAPTSPLNIQPGGQWGRVGVSARQHQVLLAGTSEGQLKRLVLVANSANQKIRALEFDSLELVEAGQSPSSNQSDQSSAAAILADMSLMPRVNPQLQWPSGTSQSASSNSSSNNNNNNKWNQYALVASSHKLLKVRINACRASSVSRPAEQLNSSATVDECLACAQVQDPFCGWCASSASCTARHECLAGALNSASAVHWTPFDSIRCSNYQPISPKNVPLQVDALSQNNVIDVNVRLSSNRQPATSATTAAAAAATASQSQLASRLAKAQFSCHFDFGAHWNRSEPAPRPSGATTKAAQARLNLHAGTVAIGCPMPSQSQRPALASNSNSNSAGDHVKVRLSVRLNSVQDSTEPEDWALVERALGMRQPTGARNGEPGAASSNSERAGAGAADGRSQSEPIERELTLYDCALHSNCRACLSAGSLGRRWACSWCPLSNKCTHNATHPDFGCAASAVASTTPGSQQPRLEIRGSHLTPSLDRAQASVLAFALDKLHQCPHLSPASASAAASDEIEGELPQVGQQDNGLDSGKWAEQQQQQQQAGALGAAKPTSGASVDSQILVPNNARRSVQVPLRRPIQHFQREKRVIKLECLLELEGAKGRFSARLADNQNVVCQETLFSYQAEVALHKAQLSVILNDNQVIETSEVILYKCHLFGINPPALTSSVATAPNAAPNQMQSAQLHHSSAAWPSTLAADFFTLMQANAAINQQQLGQQQQQQLPLASRPKQSDCSLCLNVDRKYQCSWCSNQCKHADQCTELAASTCPAPRIDSIHPTSGPLEGGTLITIEGSNLGWNEREIQDKVLVGREHCQLVMYSVSTRIVCKTGPSSMGPQAATVFVGNRAGVTSAHEKFHYKAVHLSDVNPRMGPVSGGTRLHLSGSNLNIGSRIQIFLDDVACPLDSNHEITSNQIVCVTAPNLALNSMRIARLTLQIDNSTHQLPYPFTYQPDPIITHIEPAESFVSGGRLILISGQHLASPQSTKLMVFHESRPNISNVTSCMKQNDTLVTCLTPAFSRELLLSSWEPTAAREDQLESGANESGPAPAGALSHELGGLKLKMMLLMDEVKSARHLDEYYHHLPHYLTYFEDPRLFRLPSQLVEYSADQPLVIAGEHLAMRQLDQDMLITVGAHVCALRSISHDRVVCEPPARIAPIFDDKRRLVERPLLAIVALIGSNLRYELGHMQYAPAHYNQLDAGANNFADQQFQQDSANFAANYNGLFAQSPTPIATNLGLGPGFEQQQQQQQQQRHARNNQANSNATNYLALVLISLLGFVVAFALTLVFAMARFRRSKAKQREYKRIQLQMGSLDINGQPMTAAALASGGLFQKIHLAGQAGFAQQAFSQQQQQQFENMTSHAHHGANKNKPFYHFFTSATNAQSSGSSFPPSPLTDISSLVGSSPAHLIHHQQQQQQIVKLNANGTIVSQAQANYSLGQSQAGNSGASSSSPGGSSSSRQLLPAGEHVQHYAVGQLLAESDRANLLIHHQPQQQQQHPSQPLQRSLGTTSSARNFNWTQEAPSTIVPYAVIEACNLTLEGKNAIKDYV